MLAVAHLSSVAVLPALLQMESGVTRTVDPLAGSYLVESMTRRMEDEVFAEIEKIDALGGALAAWRLHDRQTLCHFVKAPAPVVCLAPADGCFYVGTSRADLLAYPSIWNVDEPADSLRRHHEPASRELPDVVHIS